MRLNISMASANERLVELINQGYACIDSIGEEYAARKAASAYDPAVDVPRYASKFDEWGNEVLRALAEIFPTELEQHRFLNPEIPFGAVSGDYEYQSLMRRSKYHVRGLDAIRTEALREYTDLPIVDRLYVEDIDSFSKVRDVNPSKVAVFLEDGFLALSEDEVQLALERILDVPFHKKDWSGETNDLYTANLAVAGARRAVAFLLKGPGIGKKTMTIADCGKNGDQLVRLFNSPAELFVIQHVGPVAEELVADVAGKVQKLRSEGKAAHYLILDGQDTARLLHAYGELA